jgi:hypothetical protein
MGLTNLSSAAVKHYTSLIHPVIKLCYIRIRLTSTVLLGTIRKLYAGPGETEVKLSLPFN